MIRNALTKALETRGLTVSQFCKETGIRFQSLREFVDGKRDNISIGKVEIIIRYFGDDFLKHLITK